MGIPITTATATDEQDRAATVAVLPVGSMEQHGPHLPLTTDTAIACAIAQRLAETYTLMLLAPITISCSHEHSPLRGTVSISATTLYAVVADIQRSLAASGIHRLLIVNGHGGNYVLSNYVQEANAGHPPRVALFPLAHDWRRARVDAGLETTGSQDWHGGELETSILLHTAPGLVRPGIANDDSVPEDGLPHLLMLGMPAYTPTGVVGKPSQATPAKGAAILDSLVLSAKAPLTLLTAPKETP